MTLRDFCNPILRRVSRTFRPLRQLGRGTKSILGVKVNAKITTKDSSHASIDISGAVKVSCSSELYKYDGGSKITLPNLSKKGDCAHDALEDNQASITGISYDAKKDAITVGAKKDGVKVSIVLNHQGEFVYEAAQTVTDQDKYSFFEDFEKHHGKVPSPPLTSTRVMP